MAKRGPKPKSPYSAQSKVMSTRISEELFAAITKAAANKSVTFSYEVELRLRKSFEEERAIVERLGGPQTYAMLRTIAATMNFAGDIALMYRPEKKLSGEAWFNDAYAFDQAVKAIGQVLEVFRPEGDPSAPQILQTIGKVPDDVAEHLSLKNLGARAAAEVLHGIADAKPEIPLPKGRIPDKDEKLHRSIAASLGPLHARVKKGVSE